MLNHRSLWLAVGAIIVVLWVGLYSYMPPLVTVASKLGLDLDDSLGRQMLLGEPVVIVLVTIGEDAAHEGLITIKSALMHASHPLHFHVVCSEDAVPILESKLQLFSRPAYPVKVFFYPVTVDFIAERCKRAGIGHRYVLLVKVFLHELIHSSVERAIFVDTDMMFTLDPFLLWKDFDYMTPQQLVAFPTLDPLGHPNSICSCVMLLKLAAMRDPSALFMPSTLLPAHASIGAGVFTRASAEGIPVHDSRMEWRPFDPEFADQGVYHVIWAFRPELFMHLSLRWDITHCRNRYGLTLGRWNQTDNEGRYDGDSVTEEEQIARQHSVKDSPEEDKLIIPGILHFNCQGENKQDTWGYEANHVNDTFASMITVAERYKWIWLNRGDGTAKVTVRRLAVPRWWDEELLLRETGHSFGTELGDLDGI